MLATETNDQAADVAAGLKSKVVANLRQWLHKGDEVDKCNASRALGSIGATAATEDLISLLGDEDIDVCIDAAGALGALGANKAVPQLVDALINDPDGELKSAIVKALGEIADPAALPILLEIATDRPTEMIMDSNEDWDDWWDMQQQAIIALGKLRNRQATPVLKNLLADEDSLDIEPDILRALIGIGDDGEQVVIDQLAANSPLSRRRAAHALSLSTTDTSLKSLARALTDKSEDVRLAALQGLVDRGATTYLGAIELLKRDRSEKVRREAILAYNELEKLAARESRATADDKLAVNKRLLEDPDAEVRIAYLHSLQREDAVIDDDELRRQTTVALNDRDEQVIDAAIPLLSKWEDRDTSEGLLLELLQRPRLSTTLMVTCLRSLAALQRWNVRVSRVMTRMINHQDGLVRFASLQELMTLEQNFASLNCDGSQMSTPIDIVNDALDGRVAIEVEVAAVTGDTGSAANELENNIDEVEGNDEAATDSAGENQPAGATSTLDSILQDNARLSETLQPTEPEADDEVEANASLIEYRDLVKNNIVRAEWLFTQKDDVGVARDVQHLAARLLSRLPQHLSADRSNRVLNSLLMALNADDLKLRVHAAESIAQIATEYPDLPGIENCFGGLVTQFQDEQWDLKLACIRALATIRNRVAIPILASALEHPRAAIRIQAIHAITELQLNGNPIPRKAHVPQPPPSLAEWFGSLIDLLHDREPGVRYATVDCLKRCLESEEISQQPDLVDTAIDRIVDSAFDNQGGRTRDMALALKSVALDKGTENLLQRLESLPGSYERRFAIEMLEHMFRDSGQPTATQNT